VAVPDTTAEDLRCSFCGKPHGEVAKMVAGPGVQICNQCVDLSATIIEQSLGTKVEPRLPTWESLSDEQMLEHIPRVAAVADQVETNLRSWVLELRRRAVTWSRIGGALGISRQSAWERFSGEE
jgi:hypothetical protein